MAIEICPLSNGLTVIVEEMPHVESVAYEISIPGGIVHDESSREGESLLLSELLGRGAGDLDSRGLSDAFDRKGIRHQESVGSDRFFLRGVLLPEAYGEAMRLSSLMICSPLLPVDAIDPIRSLLLQDIASLEDSPGRKAQLELSKRYYPAPYSRSSMGTKEGIAAITHSSLTTRWKKSFGASGAILSVAGKISKQQVLESVERFFPEWKGETPRRIPFGAYPHFTYEHLPSESAQEQIAFVVPGPTYESPWYYHGFVLSTILSGGMFGRLFVEVREKRGLCYTVYARFGATKDYGAMHGYAGTTPQRADETLSVIQAEFRRLKGSISDEELARAKANLKASLIMNDESSSGRASTNSGAYWMAGEIRSNEEIKRAIEKISIAELEQFVELFPVEKMAVLTLGTRKLGEK